MNCDGFSMMSLTRPHSRWLGLVLCSLLAACAGGGTATTGAAPMSGVLHISGSTALQPLAADIAPFFMRQYPNVRVIVAPQNPADPGYDATRIGSKNGLANVNAGLVEIADSDVYADSSLSHYAELNDHIVCIENFEMIVNPSVTGVRDLSTSQIQGIYSTNTITNWAQVGGPNLAIKKVIRPATSGTRATFRQFVLNNRDEVANPNDNVLKQDATTQVSRRPLGQLAMWGFLSWPLRAARFCR
jgi:phosphate transport system substrate-binding protein